MNNENLPVISESKYKRISNQITNENEGKYEYLAINKTTGEITKKFKFFNSSKKIYL